MSTPALELVARSGRPYRLHEYSHDPASPYGLEAAQVLGVEAGRVFKTLVVSIAGRFAVAVIPVSCELDLKAMARALGARESRDGRAVRSRARHGLCDRWHQPARTKATPCDNCGHERVELAYGLRQRWPARCRARTGSSRSPDADDGLARSGIESPSAPGNAQ